MADQWSLEMLEFNSASRSFAYKKLAQCLSRAVSTFSNFMGEYLDPVVKAHQCAQYVEVIGIAANKLYRNYFPRMAEKFYPFNKLIKAETPINITSELKKHFIQ